MYDLYEEAMGTYREEMEGVKRRLREMRVDESSWPVEVRASATSAAADGSRAGTVVVDAFEQLERELAAKRGHQTES